MGMFVWGGKHDTFYYSPSSSPLNDKDHYPPPPPAKFKKLEIKKIVGALVI